MGEDTVMRKEGTGMMVLKIVFGVFAMGLASVLGFVANDMNTSIKELKKEAVQVRGDVKELENDRARWGTFAELKEEINGLKVQDAYNRGRTDAILDMVGTGSVAYQEKAVERLERLEELPELPPVQKPQRVDPDAFREAQQQKYPKKGK